MCSCGNPLLDIQRHSRSHISAQAVQRTLDPQAQLGTGPWIDNGCYYDIGFSDDVAFGEKDAKALTKSMQQIAKEPQTFVRYECPLEQGYEINALTGQVLKNELLDKFKAQGEIQVSYYLNVVPQAVLDNMRNAQDGYIEMYRAVTAYFQDKDIVSADQAVVFVDLCAGPHVSLTKEELNPQGIKIDKIAGAYRQADEKNQMMTRIYCLVFEDKESLKAYEHMMAEAKKRDHRVLGKKFKLFTMSPLVGAGLPLMQPNGMIIRQEIVDYLWELHRDQGYQRVRTPHIAKDSLYKCSGHYDKFGDELFRVSGKDKNDDFIMKPMNCPHHMQIFADNQFSYRDMPVRYFEPATVYRDEKAGQLSGLTRVRAITQDDGHLFCRVGQIKAEVGSIVSIIKQFYTTLGMVEEYRVSLSVRGDDGKLYLGPDEVWEQAESALQEAADANELPYKRIEGEAAFYGPKLDFMFKDAIGREWQLATIQCDFNLPERFDLSFVNEQGEDERPVVIHRAISGSLERFMGVMIEHFAGAFPVWLAPIQARIVPVAEAFGEYADTIKQQLRDQDIRAEVDSSADSFAKKIRNGEMMRIPYLLVVGEQEQTNDSVNVRSFKTKEQVEIKAGEFTEQIVREYRERVL